VVHALRGLPPSQDQCRHRTGAVGILSRPVYRDFGRRWLRNTWLRTPDRVSRETIRQWMIRAKLWRARKQHVEKIRWRKIRCGAQRTKDAAQENILACVSAKKGVRPAGHKGDGLGHSPGVKLFYSMTLSLDSSGILRSARPVGRRRHGRSLSRPRHTPRPDRRHQGVARRAGANVELRQRQEREARAVSSLAHPHICALSISGTRTVRATW